MRFSIHKKQLIFILLILLNLIVRIPSIPHESGLDSFFNHALAESISQFGCAKWWVNVLSVIGFYPFSECSGVPFILSGINQSTGIEMELTILIVSIIFGIFSLFTMYLLAGAISDDETFKILTSCIYSLSPGIITFTTWNMSTRGIFLVILPLFIYKLLQIKKSTIKNGFLAICLFLLLMTIHHFILFTIPIVFSYFLIVIIYEKIKNHNKFNVVYITLFFIAITMPFFYNIFIEGFKYTQLKELILTNIRYTGILLIYSIGGFIYLSLKKRKSFSELFMLIAIILFAPLIWMQVYGYWFFLIYSSILIGFSLTNLTKISGKNKKYVTVVLIISLCLSVSMSSFYQHWHTDIENNDQGFKWYMDEKSYDGALWTKDYIGVNKRLVGNDNLEDKRMFAISGVPTLLDASDPHMLVYGFVKIEDVPIARNTQISSKLDIESPYAIGPNYTSVGYLKNHLMEQGINENTSLYNASRIISTLNLSYVVENRLGVTNKFIQSIYTQKNNIYDNGKIVVWELT